MSKSLTNFLAGFIAGAAAGALAGILFAPDKGSKTRQNWGKKVKDLSDDYGLGLGDLLENLGVEIKPEPAPKKRSTARKTNRKKEG